MAQTYTTKSGQKITTYYKKEEQAGYIPPAQQERRECVKDASTPLGRVEHCIFSDAPITRRGRRTVGKVREGVGKIREYVSPAIREATPFAMDISTMMRAPMVRTPVYDKKGRQTGTRKTQGSQPSPFNIMAPPSYFGGIPGMQRERPRRKKGKREREDYDDTPEFMGGMMGIPEHARRWM